MILESELAGGFYGCTNFGRGRLTDEPCKAQFSPSTGKGSAAAAGMSIEPGSVKSHETPCPVCGSGYLFYKAGKPGARPPRAAKAPPEQRVLDHVRESPGSSLEDLRAGTGIAMETLVAVTRRLTKSRRLSFEWDDELGPLFSLPT